MDIKLAELLNYLCVQQQPYLAMLVSNGISPKRQSKSANTLRPGRSTTRTIAVYFIQEKWFGLIILSRTHTYMAFEHMMLPEQFLPMCN